MSVSYVLYDEKLYSRGHLVDRWFRLMTHRFGENARESAPVRTGALARGISTDVHNSVATRLLTAHITSNAPYSIYVIRGTHGPIMADRAWARPELHGQVMLWRDTPRGRRLVPIRLKGHWMKLKAWGEWPSSFQWQVRGQEANNFLAKAWAKTARKHSCLRGAGIPPF